VAAAAFVLALFAVTPSASSTQDPVLSAGADELKTGSNAVPDAAIAVDGQLDTDLELKCVCNGKADSDGDG